MPTRNAVVARNEANVDTTEERLTVTCGGRFIRDTEENAVYGPYGQTQISLSFTIIPSKSTGSVHIGIKIHFAQALQIQCLDAVQKVHH